MEYDKLRKKINKFYIGGKIPKYQTPGQQIPGTFDGLSDGNGNIWNSALNMWIVDPNKMKFNNLSIVDLQAAESAKKFGVSFSSGDENSTLGKTTTTFGNNGTVVNENTVNGSTNQSVGQDNRYDKTEQEKTPSKFGQVLNGIGQQISGIDFSQNASWRDTGLSEGGAMGMGIAAKAGTAAFNAIDQATMGDKNFGAQSQAIDSAVHGASSALMSSGNPYAMLAGAALEGANFLTKAGGQTVQGYDVNIENSGYGNLGHMESSSSRDWGTLIGLGGLFNRGATEKKLAKRNEQARMAMKAAEISEDIKFEQEARMNSVDNVLRNNLIALAGGIDTSLLGS